MRLVFNDEATAKRVKAASENPHLRFLHKAGESEATKLVDLLDYGVSKLPADPFAKEEDHLLATYFFSLSELQDLELPGELHDFLLDTMCYCEGVPVGPVTREAIVEHYNTTIRPKLSSESA